MYLINLLPIDTTDMLVSRKCDRTSHVIAALHYLYMKAHITYKIHAFFSFLFTKPYLSNLLSICVRAKKCAFFILIKFYFSCASTITWENAC